MNQDTARAALRRCGRWRTASYSAGENNCVQVSAVLSGWTGVRDSKHGGDGPVLAFAATPWRGLLGHLGGGSR